MGTGVKLLTHYSTTKQDPEMTCTYLPTMLIAKISELIW